MKIYTALLKPDADPVLVKEGFCWGALILGPLWFAARRSWIAAAISLAAYAILVTLVAPPATVILTLGLAIVLGLTGNDLRRWALENRGYLVVHVLAAASPDDAFTRLLTHSPDLGVRFRPEPV